MNKKKITELLIFIVSAELVGALSALFAGNFAETYRSLVKPPFSPPGFIFPIVWAILYGLMGTAAFVIVNANKPHMERMSALKTYGTQLLFNFLWSIIFFRLHLPLVAALDIIILNILVIIMTIKFYRIKPGGALLNIPYILWILFAAYLNVGVIILN